MNYPRINSPREDRTIYRGPSFLPVMWFGSSPAPSPLRQSAGPATHSKTETDRQLADGRGGGLGAESSDRKEARSSINHSILTEPAPNYKQASGQIFKDDMNGLCSSSDICFTRMYDGILFHTKIENYLRYVKHRSGSGQKTEVGSFVLIRD